MLRLLASGRFIISFLAGGFVSANMECLLQWRTSRFREINGDMASTLSVLTQEKLLVKRGEILARHKEAIDLFQRSDTAHKKLGDRGGSVADYEKATAELNEQIQIIDHANLEIHEQNGRARDLWDLVEWVGIRHGAGPSLCCLGTLFPVSVTRTALLQVG